MKTIEDLQHRVQVQREAAVLLAQRIEILSTKSWRDAQAAAESLRTDVPDWQTQADALLADANWPSLDAKFPPLLDASVLTCMPDQGVQVEPTAAVPCIAGLTSSLALLR